MHVDHDEMYYNYRMYKNVFGQDSYFSLLPQDCVLTLVKFRTTNNVLPVNKLWFTNIPRVERVCTKCNLHEIGDEYHYLFVCPFFSDDRKRSLPKYYYIWPNAHKYCDLFSTRRKHLLLKLKHFISIIDSQLR
jgi:hypothetical protein